MLRKATIAGLLGLMLVAVVAPAQAQIGFTNLPNSRALIATPYGSVATPDAIGAVWSNPAGIGIGDEGGFLFTKPASFDQNDLIYDDDFGFALAAGGLGFATEYMNGPVSGRRYTWGLGGELAQGLYFGFNYHYFYNLDRQNTWDFGFLARPTECLSLGLVIQDAVGGRIGTVDHDASYNMALAFRPMRGPLTLSVDGTMHKPLPTDDYEFAKPRFLAELKAMPGIGVSGGYDMETETVFAGLNFTVESLTFGHSHAFPSDPPAGTAKDGGVGYVRLSSHAYNSVFNNFTPQRIVNIKLRGQLVEEDKGFSFFGGRNRNLLETIERIDMMTKDDRVVGISLEIDNFQASMSDLNELRDAFTRFQAAGKKIVVYGYDLGMGSYYLASVADKIYLYPEGAVFLPGMGMTGLFLKGTLDKLDMEMQVVAAGKYKSAGETFTRTNFSEESRESREALLEDSWDSWLDGVSKGRNISRSTAEAWVNDALHEGSILLDMGMVDDLLYPDELKERVKEDFSDSWMPQMVSEWNYLSNPMIDETWESMTTPKIAIVYATGAIQRGKSRDGFLTDEQMGSETVAQAIRAARNDKHVKAIVLRVDSPGGSALASDIIAREIRRTTDHSIEGVRHIPVIVSMAGVAASGGYYISALADTIIADRNTITGSIGVITAHLASEPGLDSLLGITFDDVSRGKNINLQRGKVLTDDELDVIRKGVDQTYTTFKSIVADGRGMEMDRVEELAQGRVWSGKDALEAGLVDMNGGLWDAIQVAKERVGVKRSEVIEADLYPRVTAEPFSRQLRTLIIGDQLMTVQEMVKAKETIERMQDDNAMLLLPIDEEAMLMK
ncbi:signal peptide peptidase SppA [bacterium]|nr:signal peptide peptidase SppA [bacterium]